MIEEYICKQEVVDVININADDLEQVGDILYAQGARAMAIVVDQMLPVENVVHVIRCNECKHYIDLRCWCTVNRTRMMKFDFCSYGERKEE